jgi:membrane protein required for beta-lactamase induction
MDHSGMSMSMGTNLFQTTNMALARDFWYIVAGVVGAMGIARLINFYKSQRR